MYFPSLDRYRLRQHFSDNENYANLSHCVFENVVVFVLTELLHEALNYQLIKRVLCINMFVFVYFGPFFAYL